MRSHAGAWEREKTIKRRWIPHQVQYVGGVQYVVGVRYVGGVRYVVGVRVSKLWLG